MRCHQVYDYTNIFVIFNIAKTTKVVYRTEVRTQTYKWSQDGFVIISKFKWEMRNSFVTVSRAEITRKKLEEEVILKNQNVLWSWFDMNSDLKVLGYQNFLT